MISTKQIKTKQVYSTSKRIFSASIVKPLVASAVILCIDRFYFKNSDLRSNLYFAGSVGAGTFVSSSIAESTRGMIPTNTMIGSLGKNIESRVIEIAAVSGVAYGVNRLVLKNEISSNDMYMKLAAIALGDVVSEIISEAVLRM